MNKIIKFSADWCGPCRAMKPGFENFKESLKGNDMLVEIIEYNVDDHPIESQQYGITSIPATVFIKNGEVVETTRGMLSEAKLNSMFDSVYGKPLNS